MAPVWGLISDVHGNRAALEQAVDMLRGCRLAFLGDYLGRGDPDGCVALIRKVAEVAILGNRDLDWKDRVSPESKAWVLDLPRIACVPGLLLAHGDPRLTRGLDTGQVRKGFVDAWDLMHEQTRVFAFGHSHHARIWAKATRQSEPVSLVIPSVEMRPGTRYFVNVGSAGMAFPGRGGPSVARVDFSRSRIEILNLQSD